ncbi:Snf7-domain-containing protein [Syncephalis pseudoplumigaleata]|uniref:Snf7-domain-containing protein n=1 Tax=Syncephalis pseudoplumigaleata TaxID=1712513 RepID=A0A4P9YWD9_9FUNG|nr:Snf7-domain-containing protein [Syncephalis pseudoplumigaleata]|eukprot:RKP23792.1 Snf7-domain-containing protein [Syncephalis pseudoplumigaleata]
MEAVSRFIFRTRKPEELVREWRQSIRAQERQLERQIRSIETEELKVKRTIKQAAGRKDTASCRMLAKELVRSRRQKTRLHTNKAHLSSINMQLQQQLAMLKMSGTLKQSTEVMRAVNRLVRVPELSAQMQAMSMEMMKAGVISEMMEDTMDMLDDEELEDEADEEVEKVLFEVTNGKLGEAGAMPAEHIATATPAEAAAAVEEGEPELESMQARLEALRS